MGHSGGLVIMFGRYLPIIAPIAMAAFLGMKKSTPFGLGTLRDDTATFGCLLLGTIVIVGALLFLPVAALGPLADHWVQFRSAVRTVSQLCRSRRQYVQMSAFFGESKMGAAATPIHTIPEPQHPRPPRGSEAENCLNRSWCVTPLSSPL